MITFNIYSHYKTYFKVALAVVQFIFSFVDLFPVHFQAVLAVILIIKAPNAFVLWGRGGRRTFFGHNHEHNNNNRA